MAEDELGLPITESDPTTDIFSEEYTGEDQTIEEAPVEEAPVEEAPVEDEAPVQDETPDIEAAEEVPDLDEAEVEAEAEDGEDSAEELPPLIAGRFKTQDEADAYTKTTQAAYTRGQQELAETKRQMEAQRQQAEQQATYQQAQIQQMQAQMQQFQAQQLAQLEEVDPDQAAQIRAQQAQQAQAQQQTQQQEQYERQQYEMRRQLAEQQADMAIQGQLNSFYNVHPDARGREDDIAAVVRSFEGIGDGWNIDLADPDSLEIAWEIAQEPGLRDKLIELDLAPDTMRAIEVARAVGDDRQLAIAIRSNPAYGATDESLEVARQLLAAPRLTQAKDDAAAAAKASAAASRKAADIEPGNAGTSDDSAPGDDWDVLSEWKKESASSLGF